MWSICRCRHHARSEANVRGVINKHPEHLVVWGDGLVIPPHPWCQKNFVYADKRGKETSL